jgi:hypothetical protein
MKKKAMDQPHTTRRPDTAALHLSTGTSHHYPLLSLRNLLSHLEKVWMVTRFLQWARTTSGATMRTWSPQAETTSEKD